MNLIRLNQRQNSKCKNRNDSINNFLLALELVVKEVLVV
jgi:hypothetical protein